MSFIQISLLYFIFFRFISFHFYSSQEQLPKRSPSPQTTTTTSPSSQHGILSSFIPATTNPLAIIGLTAFREDSTESDQSIILCQSQTEAYHRLMWVYLLI